jgi:diguanylate cyclase (GGDEF)-like protein
MSKFASIKLREPRNSLEKTIFQFRLQDFFDQSRDNMSSVLLGALVMAFIFYFSGTPILKIAWFVGFMFCYVGIILFFVKQADIQKIEPAQALIITRRRILIGGTIGLQYGFSPFLLPSPESQGLFFILTVLIVLFTVGIMTYAAMPSYYLVLNFAVIFPWSTYLLLHFSMMNLGLLAITIAAFLLVASKGLRVSQLALSEIEMKARLAKLAAQDSLTGIPNRRSFDLDLQREWSRACRDSTSISIIMIDVDYFKLFNDAYGHIAGDECLKQIAYALSNGLSRATDSVYRYGGEEFVCILADTELEGAKILGDKLRKQIQALQIPHNKSSVNPFVTISLGACSTVPVTKEGSAKLLTCSDEQLYQAKSQGRNCIHVPFS